MSCLSAVPKRSDVPLRRMTLGKQGFYKNGYDWQWSVFKNASVFGLDATDVVQMRLVQVVNDP